MIGNCARAGPRSRCLDPDARTLFTPSYWQSLEGHVHEHDAASAATVTPGGSAVKRRRLSPTMDNVYADTAVPLDDDATGKQIQEMSTKDHWSSSLTDNTVYDDYNDEHADTLQSEHHSTQSQSQRPSRPRMYTCGSSSSAHASGSFLSQEDFTQDNAVAQGFGSKEYASEYDTTATDIQEHDVDQTGTY
jgi:hypothetical protein